MEKYTIYCNSIQTRKALELGAPLFRLYGANCSDYIDMLIINDTEAYTIPTAEQMISWLEEQGIKITFALTAAYGPNGLTDGYTPVVNFGWNCETCYVSRKEATLAAIDSALDYLMNNNLMK